ncbi:MAG: FAD:protein FMN transferase [Gammaproteobacteria bacterium]|nr:FAD:protein FMN transferase [Gammaproteobacteria bacterium]MBU2056517.1 FAD:protein FMN transferase [Gammaproteobacteria bacterium]MBU2174220.1 FAD:protein FMN transferase [Gammaproteobacteria bacterium]MBU2248729.1 FAD:protein FMN transferase [Gammaproteobacteria bacterium]MBU2344633.1 FAD:protein FMN transferase [Gammaproteobacteria bacterium]
MSLKSLSVLALLLVGLTACSQPDPIQRISGPAQGSSFTVSFWTEQGTDKSALEKQLKDELDRIDLLMSNYRPDSVIEAFNAQQSQDLMEVGEELVLMVDIAKQISAYSEGCYDLTVKPYFELWGFRGDKLTKPSAEQIQTLKQTIGLDKVSSDGSRLVKHSPGLRVDVSSIAQGYTVGQLAKILDKAGIQNYLVEVGGELVSKGKKPEAKAWRVAIEKPLPDSQKLQKIISVQQDEPLSIMTSGTYRHFYDLDGVRYSHVLDARTGTPVTHNTVSTTVLIPDPTWGDAWSTAFLCMGSEQGLKVADELKLPVLFIDQQGTDFIEKPSQALTEALASGTAFSFVE